MLILNLVIKALYNIKIVEPLHSLSRVSFILLTLFAIPKMRFIKLSLVYKFFVILFALCFSLLVIPTISHFIAWDLIPYQYLRDYLMGIIGAIITCLYFYDKDTKKVDTDKIIRSLAVAYLIIMMMVGIDSLPFYFKYHDSGYGLGKLLERFVDRGAHLSYGPGSPFPFVMTSDVNVLCLILAPAFFYELYKAQTTTAAKSIIYFAILTISISNHYLLNSLSIFFICLMISYLYKNKQFLILTAIGVLLTFGINDFSNRFNIRIFKTNSEKLNYWDNSRTTVFANAVDSFLGDNEVLIKGYGYPATSKARAFTPSKRLIAATGHSTIIDNFMYFGLIAGPFSVLIFFLFSFFWKRLTTYERIFFPSFFFSALGQLAGTSSDSFIFLSFLIAMLMRVLTWDFEKKVY